MRSQKARETAWTGMLFALAIALSYLESLVSPLLGLMPAIKLGLSNAALRIIERYSSDSHGYLFPILNVEIHKTALQKQNRIHKILSKVNSNLKLIAIQLGLNTNLTTYVARHSFATVLKKSGVNIALISEALGHSDLATTQIYLDSFDNEQIDDAMKNLL